MFEQTNTSLLTVSICDLECDVNITLLSAGWLESGVY
jgi:hypothetical protein